VSLLVIDMSSYFLLQRPKKAGCDSIILQYIVSILNILEFPDFVLYAIGHERNLAKEVGYPTMVCRRGKPRQRSAFERGRGKYSPHAHPGRVTARAMKANGQWCSVAKNEIFCIVNAIRAYTAQKLRKLQL